MLPRGRFKYQRWMQQLRGRRSRLFMSRPSRRLGGHCHMPRRCWAFWCFSPSCPLFFLFACCELCSPSLRSPFGSLSCLVRSLSSFCVVLSLPSPFFFLFHLSFSHCLLLLFLCFCWVLCPSSPSWPPPSLRLDSLVEVPLKPGFRDRSLSLSSASQSYSQSINNNQTDFIDTLSTDNLVG